MINQVATTQEAVCSAEYVKNYLDSCDNLPDDVQRYMSRIREIDMLYNGHLRDIEHYYDQWTSAQQTNAGLPTTHPITSNAQSAGNLSTKALRAFRRIENALIVVKELGDEKMQLVAQLHDLVELNNRQLETNLGQLDYGAAGDGDVTMLDADHDRRPAYGNNHHPAHPAQPIQPQHHQPSAHNNPQHQPNYFHATAANHHQHQASATTTSTTTSAHHQQMLGSSAPHAIGTASNNSSYNSPASHPSSAAAMHGATSTYSALHQHTPGSTTNNANATATSTSAAKRPRRARNEGAGSGETGSGDNTDTPQRVSTGAASVTTTTPLQASAAQQQASGASASVAQRRAGGNGNGNGNGAGNAAVVNTPSSVTAASNVSAVTASGGSGGGASSRKKQKRKSGRSIGASTGGNGASAGGSGAAGNNGNSGSTSSGSGGGGQQPNRDRDTDTNTPPDDQIDPDEPTYCLCDQISFGEMILCDNDLCPIEWFHFSCVTLTTKPKGKWYCPNCRGDRSNVMKPKAQFLKELERYNKEKEEKT